MMGEICYRDYVIDRLKNEEDAVEWLRAFFTQNEDQPVVEHLNYLSQALIDIALAQGIALKRQ